MELKIKVNFSFSKLARKIPDIVNEVVKQYTNDAEAGTKEAIDKGVLPPLAESTKAKRRSQGNNSTQVLFDKGNLYRSIKAKPNGLELLKYGYAHHEGFAGKHKISRKFITTTVEDKQNINERLSKMISSSLRKK
tara:strand:- start:353 stop:757 length:405 start_codon:yes stop_codon:yes gene_type:complete